MTANQSIHTRYKKRMPNRHPLLLYTYASDSSVFSSSLSSELAHSSALRMASAPVLISALPRSRNACPRPMPVSLQASFRSFVSYIISICLPRLFVKPFDGRSPSHCRSYPPSHSRWLPAAVPGPQNRRIF